MDPISQAALGAVTGKAVGHARLGWRAVGVGAVAGALPDIDVLFSLNGDYFDQLVLHRGITHSLFFAPVAGPLLGALVWAWERARAVTPQGHGDAPGAGATSAGRLRAWMLVVTLALLSHPLLDLLTPYGTQLLLPFSDARFAVNAMPIIDPAYTLILLTGLAAGAWRWRQQAGRVALVTLLLSCSYLAWGGYLNTGAEREARRQLAAAGIHDATVRAFPTILQLHYRRVVARLPEEDRVGFLSTWRPCDIDWQPAPRTGEHPAVDAFLASREGRIFDWFTMGWARYRIDLEQGSLVATDLRYGFDADPDRSIFSATAPLADDGGLAGPVRAGRGEVAVGDRLALLFRDTYASDCATAG
ncbi:MAG: metal-dependent hydrolase [Pseudomonadales bacterium]